MSGPFEDRKSNRDLQPVGQDVETASVASLRSQVTYVFQEHNAATRITPAQCIETISFIKIASQNERKTWFHGSFLETASRVIRALHLV